MILDMRTIIFGYVATDIVCLMVIVLLWQQNRKRFTGIGFLVFDFAFQLIALFLVILRGIIPDWLSIVLGNTLVMTGALLGYMGLERFLAKKSSQIHNFVLLATFVLVHAYFALVQPNLAARNLNISLVLLIICWQCVWLLFYRVQPGRRQLTRGVGLVFAAFCIINIVRIGEFFIGSQSKSDYLQSGIFEQLVLISYQMVFIFLTYTLILMVNKFLYRDINLQEEKYSKAFHSSPYAIILTRFSDGLIIETNEGFVNFTGYSFEEIKGKTKIGLHLWLKNEDRALLVNELTSQGKVQEHELQFRKKSGELVTGLLSAEVITINDEKCILTSIKDITRRKKAEEALQESNTYLEILNNMLGEAIFVVKYPERVFEYLNAATLNVFGFSKQEILASNSSILYPDNEEYLRSGKIFREAVEQGKDVVRSEVRLQRKNGEIFPGFFTATFLKENGVVTKFIAIVQDITEQKRNLETIRQFNVELEQRVAQRTQELSEAQTALLNLLDDMNQSAKTIAATNSSLEAVNKELAAFSYSVSHDLRAPLRSIDGFSSALLDDYADSLDEEGKSYLARIRKATQNMAQLIDDMLNLSRVTQSEFSRESVDLSKMVQKIAETHRQQTPDKSVDLIIQENILVSCDRHLTQIVLTNLLDNAWKFTGKTENPRIEFGTTVQDGKTVLFLRDNGAGFDMAYAGKLFGAFQRLHRADEFPGTGIGLATVQRVINRHGGRIWVQGEIGKGATFFFTLEA